MSRTMPTGAISAARPSDVLNAARNSATRAPNHGSHSQDTSAGDRTRVSSSFGYNDDPSMGDGLALESLNKTREWLSDSETAGTSRKEKRRSHCRRRKNGARCKEKLSEWAASRRDVPIAIRDRRSDLTKLVDRIIEKRPTLRSLDKFEPGSIPDYVDRLGLTREQAAIKFSRDVQHAYPCQKRKRQHEYISSTRREASLAAALDLERRRADVLEYQAMMFKAELIQEIKRFKVLSAVIEAGYASAAAQGNDQWSESGSREAIDSIVSLGTGKIIDVLTATRNQDSGCIWRKDKRKDIYDEDSPADISSSSMSSGTSISWSSTSDDEL
ncbi:uncharacterized protein PV09_04875 [Verruconis gallopava]|uniref:Uncharacterized protein n=1 Tax=Verruconis gallopava TaxID=253628 RepID=A0A0D1YTU0_9PEZI|nr:uncharacterized protein PV09_04875 [Verruconis gallopava]KIW04057.1 hypothetical protein PV09_04875 [Verruconis gallopava]